jgi:hypothetical protein
MRRTERSIPSRVKALAASEYANHQSSGPAGIKNYCWAKEKSNGGVCVFFSDIENPRCRYFQEAVLPLDKDLKAVFSSEVLNLQIQESRKRMIRKKCERPGCDQTFPARSNRQRFCPKCQKAAKNDRNGTWMTDFRKTPLTLPAVDV